MGVVVKLTALDRRILYELDIHCRASLAQLSRKTKASRERVHYRIKRLEREGVILNYRTIICASSLGYTSYRLYIRLRGATLEKEREITGYLADHRYTGWVVTVEGSYDLNVWLLLRDASELSDFLRGFQGNFNRNLDGIWISIFDEVVRYPKRFLIGGGREHGEGLPFIRQKNTEPYDATDLAILQVLSENARSPLSMIASAAHLGAEQTRKRIRALEERGIIVGYRVTIDHRQIGYNYYKLLIWLSAEGVQETGEFLEYARRHPNIYYTNAMLNGADVELEFLTHSKDEMHSIINGFRNAFAEHIAHYELQEYPTEHKLRFLPLDG